MWKEKAFPFTAFPLMHLSIWYWLKCFWIKLNHCFCLWRASTLSGIAEKQLGMSWALNAFECSRSIRTFEKRSWTKNITMYDAVECHSLRWIMQAMSSNVMHLQCIFFFCINTNKPNWSNAFSLSDMYSNIFPVSVPGGKFPWTGFKK